MNVGDIKEASSELQICGVLAEILPMKKGKSSPYFDGDISDGKAKVRLYGFDDNIRK